jgi:3D (Asp-Asp-Asp) domain-containing protein
MFLLNHRDNNFMRHLRHILLRKHRIASPFFFLAVLNFVFPQSAHAQPKIREEQHIVPAAQVLQIDGSAFNAVSQVLPTVPVPQAKRVLKVVATAYSSSFDETDGDPWTTASGAKVRDGIIAANGLPFGTRVRFPEQYGDKIFIVLDRMHPRYGKNRVDVWMPSKHDARVWGVQSVRMEVF